MTYGLRIPVTKLPPKSPSGVPRITKTSVTAVRCVSIATVCTWYLSDPDGELVSGIYGKQIYYYPWGYVTVQRSSGYWDVYHCSGRKLDFYSDEAPLVYYDGSWGVKHGKYWYAYDSDGDQISGVYGDQLILLNDGRWKCIRGSYITYVEPD